MTLVIGDSRHRMPTARLNPDSNDRTPELGPFPHALRAAIAASGLSLDRIQHRLTARGVQLSIATLSYWQTGRRRPERPSSLAALHQLEAVLQLPSGTLSALLGPPRPRGRRDTDQPLPSVAQCWQHSAQPLVATLDTTTDLKLRRLSQYDRVRVGANHRTQSLSCRKIVRAECDGPDRWMLIWDWQESARPMPPMVSNLRNCSLGAIHTSADSSVFAVELVFERALKRGETLVFEYEIHNPSAAEAFAEQSDHHRLKFRRPTREYVLEVQFDPKALPEQVAQVSMGLDEHAVLKWRDLRLDGNAGVHAIALDFGSGEFGVHWRWPTHTTISEHKSIAP